MIRANRFARIALRIARATKGGRVIKFGPVKRAVSYKGGFGECALVPVFVPGEHANVPSFRFAFRGNPSSPSGGAPDGATTLCHFSKCSRPFYITFLSINFLKSQLRAEL